MLKMDKNLMSDLNTLFKEKKWTLIPEDNQFRENESWSGYVYINDHLHIDRRWMGYGTNLPYLNINFFPFSLIELDNFVMEFILPICIKYGVERVIFSNDGFDSTNDNTISITHKKL